MEVGQYVLVLRFSHRVVCLGMVMKKTFKFIEISMKPVDTENINPFMGEIGKISLFMGKVFKSGSDQTCTSGKARVHL